ncbi:GNAT family N-acetyltransferase [Indiicoccus explosivorum]|uniref:GNAT family N-acetyltransferase n=1 Tax=Indiicoccus explosivorum TaxID=1917864 RepID=UPI000B437E5E|nr:GNAT family N-acetyltransferase [Indiicoccus explosivorum]
MEWNTYRFSELSAPLLYEILKLRVDVFVVEQNCPYPEIDGLDPDCVHITAIEDGKVRAYARLVPGGMKNNLPAIGRVIVTPGTRGTGLGRELVRRCVDFILEEWKEDRIFLQGQAHLKSFYESFGFRQVSEVYDEDGIPHIDMELVSH